jgi:hypothetical protein
MTSIKFRENVNNFLETTYIKKTNNKLCSGRYFIENEDNIILEYDKIAQSMLDEGVTCISVDSVKNIEDNKINKFPRDQKIMKYNCCDHHSYLMPIWSDLQPKVTFLPDLFRMAVLAECHFIILIDGDHLWPSESFEKDLQISDVSIDITVQSELSDESGDIVLSWLMIDSTYDTHINSEMSIDFAGDIIPSLFRCAVLRISDKVFSNNGIPPSPENWTFIDGVVQRYYYLDIYNT